MSNRSNNNGRVANRLVRRFAADKRKTVLALGLFGVMIIMWSRVMLGGRPGSAQATIGQSPAAATAKQLLARKVTLTELPMISGRNNLIARDFFNPHGWKSFGRPRDARNLDTDLATTVVPRSQGGLLEQFASKLRLEALVRGECSQAFINNVLVSAGDSLTVRQGNEAYLFEVVEILEDSVILRCNQAYLTLKLTQQSEVQN